MQQRHAREVLRRSADCASGDPEDVSGAGKETVLTRRRRGGSPLRLDTVPSEKPDRPGTKSTVRSSEVPADSWVGPGEYQGPDDVLGRVPKSQATGGPTDHGNAGSSSSLGALGGVGLTYADRNRSLGEQGDMDCGASGGEQLGVAAQEILGGDRRYPARGTGRWSVQSVT